MNENRLEIFVGVSRSGHFSAYVIAANQCKKPLHWETFEDPDPQQALALGALRALQGIVDCEIENNVVLISNYTNLKALIDGASSKKALSKHLTWKQKTWIECSNLIAMLNLQYSTWSIEHQRGAGRARRWARAKIELHRKTGEAQKDGNPFNWSA